MASRFLNIDVEKVFNVKPSELKYVRLLFLHNFFQGIALAVFFTAANALFLSNYDVKTLPIIYILSSFILIGLGTAYSNLEQKVPIYKLLRWVVILLIVSVLLMWAGANYIQDAWIAFIIFIWYRVTNLLSNLEFWGLSSTLFDVRQSKRLFGIISAGEVTAKLLGYLSVPILIPITGNNNLILIAGISFILTLVFLNKVASNVKSSAAKQPAQPTQKEEEYEKEGIIKKYLKSDFIILLSILSFLAVVAFTFIDFSFLSNVKEQFQDDPEELAKFFGLFYGFSKGVTILVKIFLTGRIIDMLGVKKSLLLLPIMFLVIVLGTIIYSLVSPESTYLIFLFGFMMLIHEIFRFSLHEPVFFSLFQPLHKKIRLFGQAIVSGILNPLAIGVAGIILFILMKIYQGVDLNTVGYILIVVLSGWIVTVVFANRQYIVVLQNAVKKRYFEGSEIAMQGKMIYDILKTKLKSKYPEEVIYSTELLLKNEKDNRENIILSALEHEHEDVELYALQKIEELNMVSLKDRIFNLISGEGSLQLKEAAIKAYCVIDEHALEKVNDYLEDEVAWEIRRGAITGLLKSGGLEAVVMSGQHLLNMIQSDKEEEQVTAIKIMGDLKIKNFYHPIIKFFKHSNPEVVKAAIDASTLILNEHFIAYLIDFLNNKRYQDKAAIALTAFGEKAIEAIENIISSKGSIKLNKNIIFRFCQIAGNIGGEKSYKILLRFIDFPVARIQYEALSSLKKAQYKAFGNEKAIRDKFDEYFRQAHWLYQASHELKEIDESLRTVIDIELVSIKDSLFDILSFMYDTRTIFKAKEGLLMGYSDKSANALEIIDNLISKKLSTKFALIMEDIPLDERVKKLEAYPPTFKVDKNTLITQILKEKDRRFNRWSQVVAMSEIKSSKVSRQQLELMCPYLKSEEKIVHETALFTFAHLLENKLVEETELREVLKTEKFEKVMEATLRKEGVLMEIEKVIILKSTSLFSETPENILVDVANIIKEERVDAGTNIFMKGDMGFCMYVINEGEVKVHDGDFSFATLKNRDFFGELALLDPEPRSASVTATKDSLLLRLDQDAFYELMAERMEVAKGILKILCRRIREQNDRISKLQSKTN